jgi:uncharacterized membrane protein
MFGGAALPCPNRGWFFWRPMKLGFTRHAMGKGRLEAFSDGVLAIIITIMVLELKVPHGDDLAALYPMCPIFLSYVLSFVYVGIYWSNHHHLMHTVKHVTGGIMWANLHLLFWLSLLPAVTSWAGENSRASLPAAIYGVVLLMAAVSWLILQGAIIRGGGTLATAIGSDLKGKLSPVLYALGIALAFVHPWVTDGIYAVVAMMWIVPDRRIARTVTE